MVVLIASIMDDKTITWQLCKLENHLLLLTNKKAIAKTLSIKLEAQMRPARET